LGHCTGASHKAVDDAAMIAAKRVFSTQHLGKTHDAASTSTPECHHDANPGWCNPPASFD
jgi:hypothetical protein